MDQRQIDIAQQEWLIAQCQGYTLHVGCGQKPIRDVRDGVLNIDPNKDREPWVDATLDVHYLDEYIPPACYDRVVSSHVLNSLRVLPEALHQMVRVLKPGGIMAHVIPDWSVAPSRRDTGFEWQYQHQGWNSPAEFADWFDRYYEGAYPGTLEIVELDYFPEFRWSFKFRAKKLGS